MSKTSGSAIGFFKRNSLYFVLAFCIIAVGLSVFFVVTQKETEIKVQNEVTEPTEQQEDKPSENLVPEEPVVKIVTYVLPVQNSTGIEEYSTAMVFNSQLKRYSAHLAVDFFAPEGTEVVAVTDGVIESIDNTLLSGTTVTVDHGNGIKSVYNSIIANENLSVGDSVLQGDVIGEVSVSNRQESALGAHLHFSMTENGEIINPAKYLTFGEK
ncbi:MAG: M23 family metallopeptidase [Clostridia bacterium]|nr:M23 family metallopeptidase [Clostridia bacterium]